MKIETKFELNQHIWILGIVNEKITIFDDYITEITVSKEGIEYWCKLAGDSVNENDIIKFEDKDKLYEKIIELTNKEEYKMEE